MRWFGRPKKDDAALEAELASCLAENRLAFDRLVERIGAIPIDLGPRRIAGDFHPDDDVYREGR